MPAMSRTASETTRQRASRDIVMQVLVRVGNLAIGALVTALVVRTLGATGYGEWSTTFIALTLVAYLGNFGTQGVALREAAKDPEHEHEWVGAVMFLRVVMVVPMMIVATIAIVLLHRSEQMLIAGVILILTMPFDGVGALGLMFQLRVDNRVPMLVLTVRSVLWGIAVVIIHAHHGTMVALAIAMAATNAVGSLLQGLAVLKLEVRWPRPSRKRVREVLRIGLPIGVAGALIISYARIDQLIVYVIAGSRSAGLYGAVYNLLDQAHFVPVSVLTTLAPVMAASWPRDRTRLLVTSRLTAELLAIMSLGGMAFTIVAAEPVVRLLFGAEFVPAAPALPVLAAAFVFISFDYLNGNLLVVLGRQNRLLRVSLLALVVNLAGNLILVPLIGFMGAAWMTLVTEIVVFGGSLSLILRELDIGLPGPGRMLRTLLAAVILGAGLELLQLAGVSLGVLIAATAAGYPALLFGLGALNADDVRTVIARGAIS